MACLTSFQYSINEDYIYLRVKLQAQSVKAHVQFMLPKEETHFPVTVLLSSPAVSEVSRRYDVFHPLMRTASAPNNFKDKQLLWGLSKHPRVRGAGAGERQVSGP